jgi:hypothetical protein
VSRATAILNARVTTALDMFSQADVMAVAKQRAGARSEMADVRSRGLVPLRRAAVPR